MVVAYCRVTAFRRREWEREGGGLSEACSHEQENYHHERALRPGGRLRSVHEGRRREARLCDVRSEGIVRENGGNQGGARFEQ